MIEAFDIILSLFTAREWLMVACVAYSILVLAHTTEEWIWGTNAPFWRYYAVRFGFELPDRAGNALFGLFALALTGLCAWGFWFDSAFARGAIVGVMLVDALVSHLYMRVRFGGPNPGLLTACFYLLFGTVALCAWSVSTVGLVAGGGPFALFWLVSFAARAYGIWSGLLVIVPPSPDPSPGD